MCNKRLRGETQVVVPAVLAGLMREAVVSLRLPSEAQSCPWEAYTAVSTSQPGEIYPHQINSTAAIVLSRIFYSLWTVRWICLASRAVTVDLHIEKNHGKFSILYYFTLQAKIVLIIYR
jgi:hypothetical protein